LSSASWNQTVAMESLDRSETVVMESLPRTETVVMKSVDQEESVMDALSKGESVMDMGTIFFFMRQVFLLFFILQTMTFIKYHP
jgi:hypothetical protein